MMGYILRRLALIIPQMLFVSIAIFFLLNLLPSDPAEVVLRVENIDPTPEAISITRHELGLDNPLYIRYFLWLIQLVHLNFGRSYVFHTSVIAEIFSALPATLYLAAVTLIFSLLLAFVIALPCILAPNRWPDKILRALSFLFMAFPNYGLGLIFLWLFAVKFNLFTISGTIDFGSVLLPALTLSFGYIAMYLRLIRGAMLHQLQQPYVFYARARGCSSWRILWRHVLPNALPTTLVSIGMSIPKLVAGTVVIENIFAWPGLGRLCLNAILERDYPVIQAYIILMSFLFLLFNFLIDLVQMGLDPRLRKH